MQWAVGTIAAPRPASGSLGVTVRSLRRNDWNPIVFAEPGTEQVDGAVVFRIDRPTTLAPLIESFEPSPEGRLGNFQNYLQAAADLLYLRPNADAILITEDDAEFCSGIREWIEPKLWKIPQCGCYSLYTANITSHRSYYPREMVSPTTPIMGSLALIWRPDVLRMILDSPEVHKFKGSSSQRMSKMPKWKRLAVDSFLGRELRSTGYHMRLFSRSFVRHWLPKGSRDNSACGNGAATGKRTEYSWVGENPDIPALFAKQRR